MRKRLAILANGWGTEYLKEIVDGISGICKDADIDIFTFVGFSFVNYTSSDTYDKINVSESNIFHLPDFRDFDFAILLTNSFNTPEETEHVYHAVLEAGIPAVSLEYALDGIPSIHTDNYNSMYALTEHLMQEHGAKHIVYVSGPKEHAENAIRLQAVRDAASKNGLSIQEEDILFGNWSREPAAMQVHQWTTEHHCLPDAFICANDIMAAGVYDAVTDMGYLIPDDVLVTGYDYTKTGQELNPPLATVSHDWKGMGIKAMELLFDQATGKNTEAHTTTQTQFISNGSCGCPSINEGIYREHPFDALLCDSHFRHIHLAIRKAETAEDLYQSLKSLFEKECWMEGNHFMLCLEKEFFRIAENDENLLSTGYHDDIDIICDINNGVSGEHRCMNRREAMFSVSNTKNEPGIYLFVPLYSEDKTYGFAMMERSIDIILENYLYVWTRHTNMYLEQVRRNITIADLTKKLTLLSVTDVLTGLYNRAGCEQIAYPLIEERLKQGKSCAIMLADIDRMKTINDQFGHASGDLALRTAASILKKLLPDEWIISRFGGDEFFAGGELKEGMQMETLIASISKELSAEVKKRNISFHLGLSIGYVKIEPDEEINLENDLRLADQLMYSIKKIHHTEIDSEQ